MGAANFSRAYRGKFVWADKIASFSGNSAMISLQRR
jgi:hypothetical protein